ncbi:uncharacterized protein LOC144351808 [Saccoglossus kowalevskii]
MLFADNVALSSHTEVDLQRLMNRFSYACKVFGLTISIKKTEVLGQDVPSSPSISIDGEVIDVANHFTYLGSTVTSKIDKRIAKAAAVMAQPSKKVWGNNQLTLNTKLKVYQAHVLSSLLYDSESWKTSTYILSITWQDRVTNITVLEKAGSLSMHLLLCQRRL